ncbi:MAG TPA: TonB-dependent receptor [Steroidobacteraceae bacterium]|nr:TonB-dependent receptor [Steroidobacteraceae bacterium]
MRTKFGATQLAVVSGLFLTAVTSGSLRAQQIGGAATLSADSESAGLAEIVVTATRKEEPLERVPLSVSALTKESMDEANVRSLSDIQQLTPGLQFSPTAGAAGTSTISIRGISSSVGASTTGIYIDDTPIQIRNTGNGASNAFPLIFDLDRVEVLRGPQGTLFGAGSEGGALRFITPQPSLDKWSTYVRSELSFIDSGGPNYEFGVATGGPIIANQLGFRISAWYRQDGGFIDRVDPDTGQLVAKNNNGKQSSAVKLGLTWKPVENLAVTPSLYYQDFNSQNRNDYWLSLSSPPDSYSNGYGIPEPNEDTFVLPSLRVQYDFPGVTLVSNTSYFHRSNNSTNDYVNFVDDIISGVPAPVIPNQIDDAYQVTRQNTLAQEVRLQSADSDSRLSWNAGFFYSYGRQLTRQYNYDPNFNAASMAMTVGLPFCPSNGCNAGQLLGVPLLNGNSLFLFHHYETDKQFAGYGQVDFRIVGGLKATAGVRYSHLENTFSDDGAGPFYGPAGTTAGSHSESPVTPKFVLSYQFASALVYGSASKGFRPGGSNGPGSAAVCGPDLAKLGISASPDQYDSDSLWSYELGAKLQFLDNRLHVDASVFKVDWKNIQQLVSLPACGGGFIANLGTASSTGFDLAIEYKPNANFLFGGNAGYTDAKLTSTILLPSGGYLTQSGAPVGGDGAPWSASINGEYRRPVMADYEGFLRLDGRYQSRWQTPDPAMYGYDPGYPPLGEQKQFNARMGVRFSGAEVSLFVNNLANSHSLLALNHDAIGSPLYYGIPQIPRVIGVMGTYRY